MAAAIISPEPNLPWVKSPEDRRFRRLAVILLVSFMCLGLVLNMLTLPEPEQRKLVDVSPRLAKLILEKKKVTPPPKPKIEKPKVEKKKEPEKKKEVKKKEKPKPKPKPKAKPKPSAREKAQKSGLLAEMDELADLRDSFDLDDALDTPQKSSGKKALKVATNSSSILTSQAKQTSGGITTSNLNRKVGSSELTQRKTTNVTSSIETSQQTKKKIAKQSGNTGGSGGTGKSANRSHEEIELVFQKNKGGIFAIYNRALRKNPSLEGKVVLELTIEPNGVVSKVIILSSELNDKKLEKKLVLKIKKFKFAKANVRKTIVNYPIDFLPS